MFKSGWNEMGQTAFWVALLKIMWINVLLSGDNAVVIAMACLRAPASTEIVGHDSRRGRRRHSAHYLHFVIVAQLMLLPYLKIIGGLALFYIAAKLLVPAEEDESEVEAVEHLWRAVTATSRCRYRHEPRQRDSDRRAGAQEQLRSYPDRSRHQHSDHCRGRGIDNGLAGTIPILVWAGAACWDGSSAK